MANLPSQAKKLISLVKLVRPAHWTKNLAIFAALIFSGSLYNPFLFNKIFWAFWAFNFAASATYVFNDLMDARADRAHPIKKNRPIASGQISVFEALVIAVFLAASALFLAKSLSHIYFVLLVVYFVMQFFYSIYLKNLPILDIIIIATGFIIRVYSGAFIIDAHLSVWFLLCVISVALFLASGKRRAESGSLGKKSETRASLAKYPRELLSSYVTMFGNAAWMSWALFTFFESPKATIPVWLFLAELSRTTTVNKLLMITIPVTIFGIMRYEALIFRNEAEAPEKLLLTDIALVASVIIWVVLVISILYGGVSTHPV